MWQSLGRPTCASGHQFCHRLISGKTGMSMLSKDPITYHHEPWTRSVLHSTGSHFKHPRFITILLLRSSADSIRIWSRWEVARRKAESLSLVVLTNEFVMVLIELMDSSRLESSTTGLTGDPGVVASGFRGPLLMTMQNARLEYYDWMVGRSKDGYQM